MKKSINLVVSQPILAAASFPTKREIACFGIAYCNAILILSPVVFSMDDGFDDKFSEDTFFP